MVTLVLHSLYFSRVTDVLGIDVTSIGTYLYNINHRFTGNSVTFTHDGRYMMCGICDDDIHTPSRMIQCLRATGSTTGTVRYDLTCKIYTSQFST